MTQLDRRTFVRMLGGAAYAVVLSPIVTSCGGASSCPPDTTASNTSGQEGDAPAPPAAQALDLPRARPADWDPIAFNRARANAGAVPATYLDAINAPDGEANALGKHLPYIPEMPAGSVPSGMIALMWGDPSKNHARHPNAVPDASNQMLGHWYDWIEVRKAVDERSHEQRSEYPAWPLPTEGRFAVFGGGDIRADAGKNTVYLVALPPDVVPGDTVRIFAHCLTHGEYVDYVTLPT